MAGERFSFRWGIPWLDTGFLQVPNFFFDRYLEVGLTRPEFLFVLHLARYKFDSQRGVAKPSLGKVGQQMGYSRRQVRRIVRSLEDKKWLVVTERPGKASEYNFEALARALLRRGGGADKNVREDTHVLPTSDTHVLPGRTPMSPEEEEVRIGNAEEDDQSQENPRDKDDLARGSLEMVGYPGNMARAMVAEFGGERVQEAVDEYVRGGCAGGAGDWIRQRLVAGGPDVSEDSEEEGEDE